ncbi:hypothetical protein [Halalkalibacter alkalisediminis]|uniref:Uncharacterized protein n=1 Tax=Halalkalibacter alkalisediminis TaxID=935616 RepID=A0ABV6NG25_9BACI|nr:hypothetical protein [Halalkalibacter alkalisediminis]
MITFVYFLILVLMLLLMSMFDAIVFDRTFIEGVQTIYPFELGTRRTIVSVWMIIGFLTAMFLDYRIKKKDKQQPSINK